jgi:hypothetical protein
VDVDPKHVDYLLVVLFSGTITPEDQFDKLALAYLRTHGAVRQLAAIKELILLNQHAYRLVLRGKPYLARLRLGGEIDRLPVMTTHDVTAVLDRLARVAEELIPPAPPRKRHYP